MRCGRFGLQMDCSDESHTASVQRQKQLAMLNIAVAEMAATTDHVYNAIPVQARQLSVESDMKPVVACLQKHNMSDRDIAKVNHLTTV